MKNEFDSKKSGRPDRDDSDAGEKREKPSYGREDRERAVSAFGRDKRPRISRSDNSSEGREKTYKGDRPGYFRKDDSKDDRGGYRSGGRSDGDTSGGERKSFNPNFNKDNRLKSFDADKRPRRDREDGDSERNYNRGGYGKPSGGRRYEGFAKEKPDFNKDKRGGYGRDNDSRGGKGGYGRDNDARGGKSGYRSNSKRSNTAYPEGGFDSNSMPPENYPRFSPEPINEPVRLNKYISKSGICSRREADELIKQGLITVNGAVVTELGSKVNPGDEVKYEGKDLVGEQKVYILMNKPKGFVTTVEDPNAERTVMDIVKNACKERVYPVGRLDKNSLGVLLITNDGELTKKLTHPSHAKKKVYQVSLDKTIPVSDLEKLCAGLELEDGMAVFDEASYADASKKEIGVIIHSGRNRIVRRMFEELGYRVNKLDRVYFAGLTKKGLRRGAWRYLTSKELSMLKSGRYE